MTRLPTKSRDFEGLKGDQYPEYKVGPVCSVPTCKRYADHGHHLIRRSALGGDFKWVRMPDGVVIGNITGLCFGHHNDITENREVINYEDGVYYWTDGTALSQQPPILGAKDELPEAHVHTEDVREKCSGCGRPMPRPKIDTPKEEKKPRATWAVAVPMDARENGADTLDELLENAREEMAKKGWEYGEANAAKFFVLSHALAMFVLNADVVLSDE